MQWRAIVFYFENRARIVLPDITRLRPRGSGTEVSLRERVWSFAGVIVLALAGRENGVLPVCGYPPPRLGGRSGREKALISRNGKGRGNAGVSRNGEVETGRLCSGRRLFFMAGARLEFRGGYYFSARGGGRTEFHREAKNSRGGCNAKYYTSPPARIGNGSFCKRGARGKTSGIQSAVPARAGRRMYHCVRRAEIISFEMFVFPTRGSGTPPPREARHLPGAPGRDAPSVGFADTSPGGGGGIFVL